MRLSATLIAIATVIATSLPATAQETSGGAPVPVTVDNFNRAESDFNLGNLVKAGLFGKLVHARELKPLDEQTIVRPNRDTLYSQGSLRSRRRACDDHAARPWGSLHVAQLISEDNYVPGVFYGAGTHTSSPARMSGRAMCWS